MIIQNQKNEGKNKDESNFVKAGEHIPTGFAMSILYLTDVNEDCLDALLKRIIKP